MAESNTDRIVIVDGARTPIGRFAGGFKSMSAHELGAVAIRGALERSGLTVDDVDEVVLGQVGQVGKDAFNARRAALAAGIAQSVPAYNVNRLCGSGLQAIWAAAMQLRWGGVDIMVAGGNESMTNMPFYDYEKRFGVRLADGTQQDGLLVMLKDPWEDYLMGITAEKVAAKYSVSREEQDQFAYESQRRASTEAAKAAFIEEIVPVEVVGRKPFTVSTDEHPRPETTLEDLQNLKPAFQDGGTVTAGNSSGINDGGSAVVVTRESVAKERGLTPLATLEHVATGAMDPSLMGYTPVIALKNLFDATGLAPSDIHIVEVNEAFAAQAYAVIRDAGLDSERTNPFGGGIALGHPVGATGGNLTVRVVKELARNDGEFGIVTMCIGGGQALAALFRRYDG
jgi:acetyl-CoA C-acetyltransferase